MEITEHTGKILLIESNEEFCFSLTSILKKNGFKVLRADKVSAAIHLAVEHVPDLIICSYQLPDYNGFQAYNLFEHSILRKGIPFMVVMEKFEPDEIRTGLDLGIDNFIFIPFDENKIVKKINFSLKKVLAHRAYDNERFNKLFEDSPLGIIIMSDNKVERANKAFYDYIGVPHFDFEKVHPREFIVTEGRDKELEEFYKCYNGLIKHCKLEGFEVVNRGIKVDLFVSNIDNLTTNRIIVQIIEAKENSNASSGNGLKWKQKSNGNGNGHEHVLQYNDKNNSLLTSRELEVVQLSSLGYPIKQIAGMLEISDRTVEKHRSNIMRKTGTSNIIEAIIKVHEVA